MYRKTYEVIGYAYEADLHCVECTAKRFPTANDEYTNVEDSEGNTPTPIFLGDDGSDEMYCGNCFITLAD